jgi:hypothetical protein
MEKLWAHHTELLPKLLDFQKQHFARRQRIMTYGTKARNDGQHSLNYTRMAQKPTDLEFPATSNETLDGEQEWDNQAMTQLL